MYLLRRRGIFSFALFFGAGVLTAYLFDMPAVLMLACAVLLAICAGAGVIFSKRPKGVRFWALIAFYLAVACAAGAYTAATLESRPQFETVYEANFSGRIAGNPYTDQNGQRYVCKLTDITVNGTALDSDMRLYLRGDAEELAEIGCGQIINGKGHVFCPEPSTNPHEFDFGDYLWRDRLCGYISVNYSSASFEGEPHGIAQRLFSLRTALGDRIDSAFPKSAPLVKALVTGDRRDMADDIREDFSTAGVAHLLAISGLHVTLIALFISLILKRAIGIWPSTVITIICIFLYGALVGFSPSITRSVIMYTLMCGAPAMRLPSDGTTRLSLAFLIILLINPMNIADPGFVLSFCASAGLIWFSAPMRKLLRIDKVFDSFGFWHAAGRYIAGLFSTTLCAQLATYPALALFYGTFSVVSVFSNLLLVPLCLASMIAAYVGIIFPGVAFIPDFMMELVIRLVGVCADVSWAEMEIAPPQVWLWLGMLGAGMLVSDISVIPAKIKPWLMPLFPLLIVLSLIFTTIPGMQIVFLDVEQADSAVLRVQDYTCVIDIGETAEEAIDYINGENLKVDALFLSHPHSDHMGGLSDFIEACDVETVYIPEGWFEFLEGDRMTGEWENALNAGMEYEILSAGDIIELADGATIEILDCALNSDDPGNDISLIMLVNYGLNQILFTGDARVGLTPDIDVLKVGHHGSRDATDADFLEAATPEIAVISVGRNNKYGHPDGEVLRLLKDIGAEIYRTDRCGAVTVYLDRDGDCDVVTFMEETR